MPHAHNNAGPEGTQEQHLVVSEEEDARGFVRPVFRSYRHLMCGTVTTLSLEIAETYATDPGFYDGTYCASCGDHFPVGEDGEFVWDGIDQKVGT